MTQGVKLFGRTATVTVDTLRLVSGDVGEGLRVAFSCKASLKPEPNTCELAIYNLNEDHRRQLETMTEAIGVEIEAGYQSTAESLVFRGGLRRAYTISDGVDNITHVESGDGEKKTQSAQINLAFPPGTPTAIAMKQLAKALGVSPGNLDQQAFTFIGGGAVLKKGAVLSGNASQILNRFMYSTDKEWSVQQGAMQVLVKDQWLQGTAIRLAPDSGLVGSPEVDSKGVLKCVSLMQPDVFPGRQLVIESKHVTGAFRIETTNHQGDTHGDSWHVQIEAKKIP